jgi:hypothetical protein
MSIYGSIKQANTSSDYDQSRLAISIGRVVDTNDPMQMGRVRVWIAGLDADTAKVGDIPFAIYCSPFAGHQQVQSRGPTDGVYTPGPVAFGMFNIPKVGTDVVVAYLNGDPNYRIWFGALFGAMLAGTMPHGRYTFNNPSAPEGVLDGPLSANEQPIQPLYENYTTAYTRTTAVASNDGGVGLNPRKNFEWRVRGADYQVAGLGNIQKNLPTQKVANLPDDRNYVYTEEDGNEFANGDYTQGYALSQIEPNATYEESLIDGGQNLDPQTYSWTTPGFSSIALDDRQQNCRIRLRTGSGHQILLDDTNERIYISTVQGNNWVEMDQDGSIDIYAARRVSIHSEMDVNVTAGGTFRVYATDGIHMTSGGEIRMTANADFSLNTTSGDVQIASTGNVNIQPKGDVNINSGGNLNLQSTQNTNILSTGIGAWTASTTLNLSASAAVVIGAATIDINGGTPTVATSAGTATSNEAYYTNRVPEHEPFGRIMMDKNATDNDLNNSFQLELDYDSPLVGRYELGEVIPRNNRWHR